MLFFGLIRGLEVVYLLNHLCPFVYYTSCRGEEPGYPCELAVAEVKVDTIITLGNQ